ncbi:MAG: glycosyltransferase family 2 protein [Lentisphaeria bacterium]|nr:glycosyltransferase family 2 protein [Lentisphaeria bacterium]
MDASSLTVVIPCYNEEACIVSTLSELRRNMPQARIVAVNDGSTDRTLELLQGMDDPDLVVLNLPFNSGIGVAVQTGLIYAARHGAGRAVKFDADGQHPAQEIPRLLEAIDNGADFVIGSRFVEGTTGFRSYFMRRVGIRFFRFLIATVTGHSITDATSGFRAYGHEALLFAAENYPSFDYPEPEECILFLRNGFRVVEVPCNMLERQGGRSSIRSLKAAYYMLKVSFAMIMESFRPRIRKGI